LEQQQHALEEALWQEGGVAMGEFTQHLREIRELEELYQDLELLLKELTPPLGSQAHGESRAKRIEP
jgi:hypothetical protein